MTAGRVAIITLGITIFYLRLQISQPKLAFGNRPLELHDAIAFIVDGKRYKATGSGGNSNYLHQMTSKNLPPDTWVSIVLAGNGRRLELPVAHITKNGYTPCAGVVWIYPPKKNQPAGNGGAVMIRKEYGPSQGAKMIHSLAEAAREMRREMLVLTDQDRALLESMGIKAEQANESPVPEIKDARPRVEREAKSWD